MSEITLELKSHFLRLYQMAFVDDDFSKEELQMLYSFAKERGVSEDSLKDLLMNPTVENLIPESLDEKVTYLYDLALMIWADGVVTIDEENSLKKYIRNFGFEDENIDGISEFLLDSAKMQKSIKEVINEINS